MESINKELRDELKYVRSMGNNNWRNNYELEKKVEKIIKHLKGRDLWTIEKPVDPLEAKNRQYWENQYGRPNSSVFGYCLICERYEYETGLRPHY